jgi:hypothetical protein
MSKKIAAAVQLDADTCNAVDPPVRGCHAGIGIHVDIPADWLTRILAGQQVPGCSYHAIDGSELTVSDRAIAQLAIPAVVNALPAPLKAEAPLLVTKLATGIVVAAQVEKP